MLLCVAALQDEGALCEACVASVDIAYGLLSDGFTKDVIELALDDFCSLFDRQDQVVLCSKFINEEYEHLIAWMSSNYSSETLCTLMGACDYPYDPIDSVCDTCMVGFTFLNDVLDYKPTQDVLEFFLGYICRIFPEGEWRVTCEDFVDKQLGDLIDYIDTQVPPRYTCTMIGACDFPVTPLDAGCEACKKGFGFIQEIFDFDNSDGRHLAQWALDHICYAFPADSTGRSECVEFINEEYEHLVVYLENEFSPSDICTLVEACSAAPKPEYQTECEFCRVFYQLGLDILGYQPTAGAVETLLDQVCRIYPEDMRGQCEEFNTKFYEGIVKGLQQYLPTEVACEAMGACFA